MTIISAKDHENGMPLSKPQPEEDILAYSLEPESEVLSGGVRRTHPAPWRLKVETVDDAIAVMDGMSRFVASREKQVPFGIADAEYVTRNIVQMARSTDRFLAGNVRELFAILATAYPVAGRRSARLDHRAHMLLRILEVVHPRESKMVEVWLIYITILAQARRMPATLKAARSLIAKLARQYPRRFDLGLEDICRFTPRILRHQRSEFPKK